MLHEERATSRAERSEDEEETTSTSETETCASSIDGVASDSEDACSTSSSANNYMFDTEQSSGRTAAPTRKATVLIEQRRASLLTEVEVEENEEEETTALHLTASSSCEDEEDEEFAFLTNIFRVCLLLPFLLLCAGWDLVMPRLYYDYIVFGLIGKYQLAEAAIASLSFFVWIQLFSVLVCWANSVASVRTSSSGDTSCKELISEEDSSELDRQGKEEQFKLQREDDLQQKENKESSDGKTLFLYNHSSQERETTDPCHCGGGLQENKHQKRTSEQLKYYQKENTTLMS
ncbi:unnamed protein product, partial [Amoebophrya sp. A25]|eukprot:GSA25T00023987001.1